jgi:SAM-dependent methyltransferase
MSGWAYDGTDICIKLFDACLKAGAPMRFEPGMRVLEVGCCESDWLERAQRAWPETAFIGIDTRIKEDPAKHLLRLNRDVMDPDAFEEATFDAVVGISSLEHIGLGHYGDPKHVDGDSVAFRNISTWLKPGGWLYFDVPYDPLGYWLAGAHCTECRVYHDWSITRRLWLPFIGQTSPEWAWSAYADVFKDAKALIDKPEASHPTRFYCVACVWQKAVSSPETTN